MFTALTGRKAGSGFAKHPSQPKPGKPAERQGRKATGLPLPLLKVFKAGMAAGPPDCKTLDGK